MIRSGSTGHLVGPVVHEGQVDGHHQEQVPNAFPWRSFANVDRAVRRLRRSVVTEANAPRVMVGKPKGWTARPKENQP